MSSFKYLLASATIVITTAAAVSCNTLQSNQGTPQPTPAPIENIDGRWRHAAADQMPAVCLTIGVVSNRRVVTQIDVGCTGTDQIVNVGPIQHSNNNVSMVISVSSDPNDANPRLFTYQLVTQSDGTIRGPGSIQNQTTGAELNSARTVVLVRVPS